MQADMVIKRQVFKKVLQRNMCAAKSQKAKRIRSKQAHDFGQLLCFNATDI